MRRMTISAAVEYTDRKHGRGWLDVWTVSPHLTSPSRPSISSGPVLNHLHMYVRSLHSSPCSSRNGHDGQS